MAAPPEYSVAEVTVWRDCVNDLIRITTCPTEGTGLDPGQIAGRLADTLLETLRLDFVCLRLNEPPGGRPIELARAAESLEGTAGAPEIIRAMGWPPGTAPAEGRAHARISLQERVLSIASVPIGLRGDIGVVVAGSSRLDFPTRTESLVLDVAANQACTGLQKARLLSESERNARLVVDSIPGLVALLMASGEVDFVNRQILEYTGKTLEGIKHWGTDDTVHPEDLPHVIQTFTQSITSGSPYQIMQRLRRADGAYRWYQNNGFPLRDANGGIVRWCVLLTDIDERKRTEDALHASERESRLIVDSIPGFIVTFTPEGEVDFINKPALAYFGKTLEDLRQWGSDGAIHPDDLPRVVDLFTASIASGRPFEFELRARRHDGAYRWFQSRGFPLRDANRHIVRWYNLLIDIDERRRAEDAIRVSENGLRQMTETIPEMLWSATAEGAIDYCNTRFLDYTGLPADEIMGDGWRKTIHPDDAALVSPVWRASVATGAPYRVEVRTFHVADHTYRWCTVTALPLRDQYGRIQKWHGTIVDMHDWKQAEEDLRNTQAALAHLTRIMTMGEMTASIAHEVNQPLSGIIINANTSLRMLTADPPDLVGARETALRTIRDANRASDVVTRIRGLVSKKEFVLELLDLNEATREVVALSLTALQRNRVVLHSELADDLPDIAADRIQIQQVILNLLRNASDAMSDVHDRPRLLLIRTERAHGERVRLTVRDAGVGVDPQRMDKLFDAFYTTKSDGMGVGLSICRTIIERHHGRLWAEANEGPGATFSFSIPLDAEALAAG